MAILWSEDYKIGLPKIDAEHEAMFSLVDAFIEADDKAARSACATALSRYTHIHFDHEEQLMHEVNYPSEDAHIGEHRYLIQTLDRISAAIANESIAKSEIVLYLSEWLLGHISTSDKAIAEFISQRK